MRFPTSNLDPLRFTAQNGNQPRTANATEANETEANETETNETEANETETNETETNETETSETEAASSDHSPSEEGDVSSQADSRAGENADIETTVTPLANGREGGIPVISEEMSSAGWEEGAGGSKQDQLDRSLHRREGNIYNLVAITVSHTHTHMYMYVHTCGTYIQERESGQTILDTQ